MKAYQMKITIKGSKPPIWRRFIVPAELSFSQLSVVLNEVMGWCGYHLFSFEFANIGLRLEEEDEFEDDWLMDDFDQDDPSEIMLEAYLDEEKRFTYTYDFGDDWQHSVVVEKVIEDYEYNYPAVLKFKGDTPYEDCGGIYGYYQLLDTLKNPSDPQYEEMKEWTEENFTSEYDLESVNSRLKRLKLTNKKSKPMRQKEIYEEIMSKGQGLKKIQGCKEPVHSDCDDLDGYDEYDDILTEFDRLLEELEGSIRRTASQNWGEALKDVTLQDIYQDYTKDVLADMAKLHHIKGYSKYNKDKLIEFLAQNVLDRDVMSRYFTFLNDKELGIIEKAALSNPDREISDEDIENACVLVAGGYCGVLGMMDVLVPEEVIRRYQEINDPEWRKAREKALSLCNYLNGAADLYGICSMKQVLDIYKKYTGRHVDELVMYSFCELIPETKKNFTYDGIQLVHKCYVPEPGLVELKKEQKDKPFYIPAKEEIEMLGAEGYLPFDHHMEELCTLFFYQFEMEQGDAKYLCIQIQDMFREGFSVDEVFEELEDNYYLRITGRANLLKKHLTAVWRHTRKRADRGNLPAGTAAETRRNANTFIPFNHPQDNIVDFPVDVKKKIYPNDLCPCGSGKKYKHCCGRNKK